MPIRRIKIYERFGNLKNPPPGSVKNARKKIV